MNYKKLIKSRSTRIRLLHLFRWVPDNIMLSLQYRLTMGRWPDFNHPTRFTEKIQLYKMKYRNPLLPICVDKYEVRRYVNAKGLGMILNDLYGVYDSPESIDFDTLPNSFILKSTSGGGGLNVLIVHDKQSIDKKECILKLKGWCNRSSRKSVPAGREWAYSGLSSSRIIAERLLVNPVNPYAGIEDYKVLCFAGKPKFIIVDVDRFIEHKRNIYTTEWVKLDVTTDHNQVDRVIEKPNNLGQMLSVAAVLASDFPFVRVDLYNVSGKVIFGELTFYPWSGYVRFVPDEFDVSLGKLIDVSSF